jgi:Zn-dependent protease with chaperone function
METTETTTELIAASGMFASGNLADFIIRYGLNLLMIVILVRFIYYPRHKNKDFLFTFFLFNTVNFLICFLLSSLKLKLGFAFGLFAIFSILRYRTVSVPIREMGYFFICVTIGIINALADINTSLNDFVTLLPAKGLFTALYAMDHSLFVLLISDAMILGMIIVLDRQLSLEHENWKDIIYERIDLIKPDKRKEMIADLENRTGLPIHRVEIIKIDFLRDIARIRAFYLSAENETSSLGTGQDDD